MSRIGNMPITIPKGVEVKIDKNSVNVKGPKGQMQQEFRDEVKININNEIITFNPSDDEDKTKTTDALLGLYRSLVNNMVVGVSNGFSKTLLITGTGYKAEFKSGTLKLNLGFSHPVEFKIPKGIECNVEGVDKITISGYDKQIVGQLSANIRRLRPPEPYKGKGIRYSDEIIRRKAGKVSK